MKMILDLWEVFSYIRVIYIVELKNSKFLNNGL